MKAARPLKAEVPEHITSAPFCWSKQVTGPIKETKKEIDSSSEWKGWQRIFSKFASSTHAAGQSK